MGQELRKRQYIVAEKAWRAPPQNGRKESSSRFGNAGRAGRLFMGGEAEGAGEAGEEAAGLAAGGL
jgi:hypothetical protein